MRDYIILNNKNSNEIKGLLIQNLPPITKPRIRAEIDEIDGRDGDIVTPLGYGAYDKVFSIGLYGDFDINEVIKYFDSEGIVVFSNEPNKYYNYKILEQIDFEKLIRFRTADVMMHVQPFKYSTTEGKETEEMETKTASGSEIDLPDTNNEKLQMEKLKGDTHQDTIDAEEGNENEDTNLAVNDVDPSKENYITLKGNTTQDQHESQNLLQITAPATQEFFGITITNNGDGTFTLNGTATNPLELYLPNLDMTTHYLGIKKDTDYFLNGCMAGGSLNTYNFIIEGTTWYADTGNGVQFNSHSDDAVHAYLSIARGVTLDNAIFKPMLIEGTEAIPFEPYGMTTPSPQYPSEVKVVTGNNTIKISNEDGTLEANYPINLGNLELCKIGNYQDYLFKRNGKWYVHKAIGKKVVTSSEILAQTDSYSKVRYFKFNKNTDDIDYNKYNNADIYYTSAKNVKNVYNYDNEDMIGKISPQAENIRYWLGFPKGTTLAQAKEKLVGSILYYILATPTEEEITDTSLIAQLDNLHTAELQETSYINSTPAKEYPYINLKYNVVTPAPSPDRASEINKVTGNNVVSVSGKNLFPINNIDLTLGGVRVYTQDGIVILNGTATSNVYETSPSWQSNMLFNLKKGTYTLSLNTIEPHQITLRNKTTGNILARVNGGTILNATFTLEEDAEVYLGFYLSKDTIFNNLEYKIQLEEGSTATDFEKYTKTDYPISLGTLELCKIGNYQDYLYKNNGKWYVHKEIGKKVFDGTETLNKSTNTSADIFSFALENEPSSTETTETKCNYLKYVSSNAVGSCRKYSRNIYLIPYEYGTATINEFKTTLSTLYANGNPYIVYYVLATPTEEEITDETLLAQLEALDNIYNQKGTTKIKTNPEANNMPLTLDVSYTESRPITITNSGNIYSKPIFTIYGEGNIGVYLNDIQLFNINLGSEEQITIDVAEMQAYNKETKVLKNRLVTGSYDKFLLKIGENKISFSGIVKKFEIENYSRWI